MNLDSLNFGYGSSFMVSASFLELCRIMAVKAYPMNNFHFKYFICKCYFLSRGVPNGFFGCSIHTLPN